MDVINLTLVAQLHEVQRSQLMVAERRSIQRSKESAAVTTTRKKKKTQE